jgi:hypothetical protein
LLRRAIRCCQIVTQEAALADSVGLVEKVVSIPQRLLCVLVDRNDRLDVLEAMAFTRRPLPQFGEGVELSAFSSCHFKSSRIAIALLHCPLDSSNEPFGTAPQLVVKAEPPE